MKTLILLALTWALQASAEVPEAPEVPEVEVKLAGCHWRAVKKHHKEGGTGIKKINTVENCAKYCIDQGCTAFDYDGKEKPWEQKRCWLHFNNRKEIEPDEGVVFYQLIDCITPTDETVPTEAQPTETQPDVEQPTEDQSDVEQPTETQPDVEQPTEDQPDVEQPTEDQPDVEQPTETQPDVEQPTNTEPEEPQPNEESPQGDQPSETDQNEPENPFKRTVILIKAPTQSYEYIFFRGGIDFGVRKDCSGAAGARESPCSIPIKQRPQKNKEYTSFSVWSENDQVLDWGSSEPGQGAYNNIGAKGSPGLWTTNDQSNPLYSPFNTYGEHYWMLDVEMDCSQTLNGWFDFKTYRLNLNNGQGNWENDISGQQTCDGEEGSADFSSKNHHAKCGALNVFTLGSPFCKVESLDNNLS